MHNIVSQLKLEKKWFLQANPDPIKNHYQFDPTQRVGNGASGEVHLGCSVVTGKPVAIKQMNKAKINNSLNFRQETKILSTLDHPNILKVFEIFEDPFSCYLVTDYYSGGHLIEYVQRNRCLCEQFVAFVIQKVLAALSHCHNHKICHRDIKPVNIMFTNPGLDSDVKLIDFGLGREYSIDEAMRDVVGTTEFMAPELLAKNYSYKVDCWSVGVVMYFLLSGELPFTGATFEEKISRILHGQILIEGNPRLINTSPLAKDLLARLLVKAPELRLNASQALVHPWIQNYISLSSSPLTQEVYEGIDRFLQFRKLKKLAFMFIATKANDTDIDELKKLFMGIDQDHDGLLSFDEFQRSMNSGMFEVDPAYIETAWQIMDSNHNGLIDYTEFLTSLIHCQQKFLDEYYLQKAFEFFDTVSTTQNRDSLITMDELLAIFQENLDDRPMLIEKLELTIKEVDLNQDGVIDYSEYVSMMRCITRGMKTF